MDKIIDDLWNLHVEKHKDIYNKAQNDAVIYGTGIMRYNGDKLERINPQDFYKKTKRSEK